MKMITLRQLSHSLSYRRRPPQDKYKIVTIGTQLYLFRSRLKPDIVMLNSKTYIMLSEVAATIHLPIHTTATALLINRWSCVHEIETTLYIYMEVSVWAVDGRDAADTDWSYSSLLFYAQSNAWQSRTYLLQGKQKTLEDQLSKTMAHAYGETQLIISSDQWVPFISDAYTSRALEFLEWYDTIQLCILLLGVWIWDHLSTIK